MRQHNPKKEGSTLVVTIIVVFTLLVLLGTAVDYSTQMSRNTQRSRKTALAMEIADGHLEYLFTNWRNIYRTTWSAVYGNNTAGTDYSVVGTNYFYTICPSCTVNSTGAAPTPVPYMTPSGTPPAIQLPPTSNFPTESNYTVSQYRIQAVDPMIDLDADGNALVETSNGSNSYVAMNPAANPPAAFGPNPAYGYNFPYSYYYLASADVTLPALTGTVTAKVRRVFEKKYDLPWSYVMFFVDDLELQPSAPFSINGPIHTNSNLYIGTSNFTTNTRVEYGTNYVNGYSPNDPNSGSAVTSPNFARSDASLALSDSPPYQTSPYLPFGWNLDFSSNSTNTQGSYHEVVERPAATVNGVTPADPLQQVRFYHQAGLKVLIDPNNNVTILDNTVDTSNAYGYHICTGSGSNDTANQKALANMIYNAITALNKNQAFYDNRELTYMRVTNVDISKITSTVNTGSLTNFNGIIYFSDTTTHGTSVNAKIGGTNSVTTTERGFRLINGASLPTYGVTTAITGTVAGGLTVVSENPVYILGDYNTGGTGISVPSNVNPTASPTTTGYTRQPAAVIADSINVLSRLWTDTNSTQSTSTRVATSTTINAALVTGNVPSNGTSYSGGGENFIRLQEDWKTQNFVYYGSMIQLFKSMQGAGSYNASGSISKAPATTKFFYDTNLSTSAPPGNLIVAAYLQQQRWYQVY